MVERRREQPPRQQGGACLPQAGLEQAAEIKSRAFGELSSSAELAEDRADGLISELYYVAQRCRRDISVSPLSFRRRPESRKGAAGMLYEFRSFAGLRRYNNALN